MALMDGRTCEPPSFCQSPRSVDPNNFVDSMHGIDMGLAHHSVENVLWLLCFEPRYCGPRHATPAERLDHIWDQVKILYQERRNLVYVTLHALHSCLVKSQRQTIKLSSVETTSVKILFCFGCSSELHFPNMHIYIYIHVEEQ